MTANPSTFQASQQRLCPRCRSVFASATCPRDGSPTAVDRTESVVGGCRLTVLLDVDSTRALWRGLDTQTGSGVVVQLFEVAPLFGAREIERCLARHKAFRHPNVAPIVAHGRTGDAHFLVYAYEHELRTVASVIAQGPLAWRDALDVARYVLTALASAQEANLHHDALRPRRWGSPIRSTGRSTPCCSNSGCTPARPTRASTSRPSPGSSST
ncbi:MAG: hypothetical protein U1F43_14615 [Myxococcota bacterium]